MNPILLGIVIAVGLILAGFGLTAAIMLHKNGIASGYGESGDGDGGADDGGDGGD